MGDECIELKNIKYRTMLLNGINTNTNENDKNSKEITDIDDFLQKEMSTNKNISWNKLDNSKKIKYFTSFVDDFSEKNSLSDKEKQEMMKFIKTNLQRRKFQKIKDVIYDKDKQIINSVPSMIFNSTTRKFSLKRSDKKTSITTSKLIASKKRRSAKRVKSKTNGTVKQKLKSPKHAKPPKIIKNTVKKKKKDTTSEEESAI